MRVGWGGEGDGGGVGRGGAWGGVRWGGVGSVGACMRNDRHVLHEDGLREGRRRAHLQRDDL